MLMNKQVKRYLCLFIFSVLGCMISIHARSVAPTDSLYISVKLLRKNNLVKLRWVTPNAQAWKNSQSAGFKIERFTIKRDGEFLSIPERRLLQDSLTAMPLMQWEQAIKSNHYAAVVAQALYGDSFTLSTTSTNPTDIKHLMAQSNEQEQRFWVSMYAADLNFSIAQMAGWGYVDSTIKNNEEYLYRVYCADTTLQKQISHGIAVTDIQEEYPIPSYFKGNFGDRIVLLSWDITYLRSHYVAYQVERSTDNIHYSPCFSPYVMNIAGKDMIVTPDSLPENDKTYYYRLYGITPFGERGPYSAVIQGEGFKPLSVSPDITNYEVDSNGILTITWDMDSIAQHQLKYFELRRSISEKSGFSTVKDSITPTTRSITYTDLLPSNYFVLAAIPHKGYETASLPFFVQTIDSIPPMPPIGLTGKIDSSGIVTLSWVANTESDIYGYRIYRRLSNKGKLFFMNDIAIENTVFIDTVSLTDLNTQVYYAVAALDKRYNQSLLSDTLKIVKPDIIPPTSPALKAFAATDNGIKLQWISSSANDAKTTIIYRANAIEQADFVPVKQLPVLQEEWTDSFTEYGKMYHYVLKSVDVSGNLSNATPIISITAKTKTTNTLKLNIDYLPLGRLLTWKLQHTSSFGSYEIYRSIGGAHFSLWKRLPCTDTSIADTENPQSMEYNYFIKYIPSKGYPIFSNQIK